MNLPPLPLIDGNLVIDNSFLEVICDREKQYALLEKRVPAYEKSALSFGSAIHAALEWRYRNCKNDEVDPFAFNEQVGVLREQFESINTEDGDFRTLDHAIEIVRHYNQKYHLEQFNLLQWDTPQDCVWCEGKGIKIEESGVTTPTGIKEYLETGPCLMCSGTGKNDMMVELPFVAPLYVSGDFEHDGRRSIPVLYAGRIDLPVNWGGQIIVMDHKTASQLGRSFEDEHHISPQMIGYCWAFEHLTGKKVDGFCVNGIRTQSPPAKPRDGIEAWWDASFWRSGPDYLKPGQVDEWKHNTIELVEEFLYHYSRGYMPRKAKQHCVSKYGRCGFYDVCDLQQDLREQELASDKFRKNEWSPLRKPTAKT